MGKEKRGLVSFTVFSLPILSADHFRGNLPYIGPSFPKAQPNLSLG